jgi:hypothetical protein
MQAGKGRGASNLFKLVEQGWQLSYISVLAVIFLFHNGAKQHFVGYYASLLFDLELNYD